MKNFSIKRFTASLLFIVMVVAALPVSLFSFTISTGAAEGDTIYVLAGGDFQEAGDHANSAANVTNILAQVSRKYETMDGFLFIGDYDCETHNSASETANGITALMGAVQSKYSNLNYDNSVLVQGNHDYMDSHIDATGGHEFDGYSAYVLNEDDYPNDGGSQSGVQTLANNMKTWLNNKIGEGYSAPIFIVSHLPLAYTPRTVTQGDAKYAKYIFDVLNDAGKNGLNIIFLHGHDHAYGPDNYMGGEAIYLPVGDKICIAEAGSTSKWTEETLNFTYMNAGYTGYYSDPYTYVTTAGTDKLTMTVFAITDNQVTVERYSEDGLYNLKSAGYDGSYSNTSVTNESLGLPKYSAVYTSPQTITLATNDAADMGTIGEWVGVSTTVTDDVTTSNKGWVELIAPVPDTPAVPGSTKYKYVLDTDGVNTNTKYLIVNTGSNGDAYVLTNNNGAADRTKVTISNGEIVVDNDANVNWIFSNATRGTVSNTLNNRNYYLSPNNGSLSLNINSTMTISNQNNGAYKIYRSARSGNTNYYYYLTYSNNIWTGARTRQSNGTSGIPSVYLFAFDRAITTEGTPAVPGKNGTYATVTGELSYTATAGMSAQQALDNLKAQLTGYVYEGMSAPGTATAGEEIHYDQLKVEWAETYSPNTAGDYKVTVSYNGTVLGTAEVVVPATTTYYAAEGNGLYLVDMNTTEANAMAAVKAGVTVYSATDASGSNKTEISDADVTWNWVDTYNGADSGPYTVEILKDGNSLGTVEVKVNIRYETGIESDWTYIGETEATGGSYTYTLDTDGIDYGEENKYIIVDDNESIVLNANSSSNGTAHSITISGNTATLNTRDYEYHMIRTTYNNTRYELITKGNGSQYLYQESNGVRYGTRSSVKFQVNHHGNGVYDIHDIDGTNWYIIYNGGWTVTETTSARVRLYKYTGMTGGTPAGSIYALIEGKTVYTVDQGSSATKALAAVKAGITGYTATDANGTGKTELSDSDLTWKWKNTFNGNSTGSYWVEISYEGKVLGTVEVKVEPGVVNNYPEYPDEGAVKVNKTATGIDFQSSGIAQVEISASGVPVKKGADVILMLDTSSSMTSHTVTGTSKTRAQVLEESLKNLITQFKTPGDDGQLLDIRVAIADFNGFYGDNHNSSGTPYDRDAADMMSDDISYNANSQAQVYTGDGTLGAGAFIPVEDLAASYTLNYTSGTNYDYAFDAIYQMGTAIKEANTEDRDLYVIFMSDGAAMQWNYYHSQGASSLWNNWITGAWTANQLSLNCNTHAYYYDEVDHNGDGMRNEHRMANAVKGDPNEYYEVIRKTNTLGTPTGETNMYMVPGLGAKLFSISFDAKADTNVTEESMDKSIESLATPQTGTTQYYYKVTTADELKSAFTVIGAEIAYAASNARFVDQMGESFNLQMSVKNYDVVDGTNTTSKSITPKIEIISYDIYTRQDYLNGTITEDKIGDRKGTSTILETVTFSADGTKAYSDQIDGGKTNILADGTQSGYVKGVIYAKTFIFNTNATAVAVEGVNIPTDTKSDGTTTGSTNMLPSETFYWKMGTVQTSELAMRYYVYLDGSMEGTKAAGSYATNEFAVLYYDNYLGNPCYKETTSPVMAWLQANVSYAFYLVDENGKIIVNQTTGETGSFANKIAVTNPVVHETVLLNNDEEVSSIDIASLGVLPEGYTLYDYNGTNGATYTVTINSNTTGSWVITTVKGGATTYVMQYDPEKAAAYSNDLKNSTIGHDYTHTVVWFAVVWKIQALPDSVVIDYGLPVDISVLTNDMFGENGKLAGVGAYSDSLNLDGHDTTLASGFGKSYTGTYGVATANTETGKVRYALSISDGMQMSTYEKFAYAVNYTGASNPGYYYDTITVIPATSIYYEESFVTTTNAKVLDENGNIVKDDNDNDTYVTSGVGAWETVTDSTLGYTYDEEKNCYVDSNGNIVTQDEDRPGEYSLADHNNLYGYDGINSSATTYSLGNAKKVSVNSSVGYHKDNSPTASFTFTGTGFDIISMTNSDSGAIFVYVTPKNPDGTDGTTTACFVDNYYSYAYDEATSEWYVLSETDTSTKSNAIYQVPVIKWTAPNNAYGTYAVTIYVTYGSFFDHNSSTEGYSFWLDSIRIYDPADDGIDGEDTTIKDAYVADGESYPRYLEIKNAILAAQDTTSEGAELAKKGVVFIDGNSETKKVADYDNPGPNNEAYLGSKQSISFRLVANAEPIAVHVGAKLAYGTSVSATLIHTTDKGELKFDKEFKSTTDMYYDITNYIHFTEGKDADGNTVWTTGTITIINNADNYDSILSLTNIKATFASATASASGTLIPTSASTGVYSLMSARMINLETVAEEEPVSISFLVDAEVIEDACAVMTELYAPEPEIFVPEALEYTVTNRFFGNSTVNVITSKDVASLTVNGVEAKKLSNSPLFSMLLMLIDGFESRFGTNISANDYIVWSASVKRASNYDIVAYNADGLSSDPTVTDSSSSITKEDIDNYFNRSELYSIMEQMASQRFDPAQFEAYVNERFDGFREIITETSEDVEYVIINGKIVNRYITETVIDTETGETTTKRVWITDAEDDVDDEDVEVNAYDEKGVGSESKWAERKFGWKKNSNSNNNNNSNNGNSNSASDKNNKNNKENNGKGNSGKYGRM